MKWLAYFFLAFIVSFIGESLLVFLKNKKFPQFNSVLNRFGGANIVISFLVVLVFNKEVIITSAILAIAIGSLLILAFGLLDDIKNISWQWQLVFQLLLGLFIIFFGFKINYISGLGQSVVHLDTYQTILAGETILIISSLVIIFWLVALINAINWADGVDGLAGGIGILGFLAIFLVSLRAEVNQPAIAIMSLIIIGAILGFWWYNFPKSQIEAGSSGSYFLGFALATMSIMAGTKIATTMIILALPLVDALWVIGERKKEGKSVFKKDEKQRHLHYRLRNLGWSDRKILAFYLGFLTLMLTLSICIENRSYKLIFLTLEFLFALGIVYLTQQKEKLLKTK